MAFRQCMWDTYETQMNSVFGFVSCVYNVSYINISKPTKPETLNTSGPKPFQIKNAGSVFAYVLSRDRPGSRCWADLGIWKLLLLRPLHGYRYSKGKLKFLQLLY